MTGALEPLVMDRHDLNNLFGKILGAAELALDLPCHAQVRQELETIIKLAEEGGTLIAAIERPRLFHG